MTNTNPPTNGFNKHPENIDKSGQTPPRWTWKQMLIDEGEQEGELKIARRLRVVKRLYNKAESGDIRAAEVIMNRTEGLPKQVIEIDNPEERIKQMKKYIDEQVQSVDTNISSK